MYTKLYNFLFPPKKRQTLQVIHCGQWRTVEVHSCTLYRGYVVAMVQGVNCLGEDTFFGYDTRTGVEITGVNSLLGGGYPLTKAIDRVKTIIACYPIKQIIEDRKIARP